MVISEFQIISTENMSATNIINSVIGKVVPKFTITSFKRALNGSSMCFSIDDNTYYFVGAILYNSNFQNIMFRGYINTNILKTQTLVNYKSVSAWYVNTKEVPLSLIKYLNKQQSNVNLLSDTIFKEFIQKHIDLSSITQSEVNTILNSYLEDKFKQIRPQVIMDQLNGILPVVEETPQVTEAPIITNVVPDVNGGLDWLIAGQQTTNFNPALTIDRMEQAMRDIADAPRGDVDYEEVRPIDEAIRTYTNMGITPITTLENDALNVAQERIITETMREAPRDEVEPVEDNFTF